MAHQMADAAELELKNSFALSSTSIKIERYKEKPSDAFGNGSGIK